jgi:DNA-binding transcriptional LysR family regulator
MDIRQLKTFITVAKLNSFTQTANQLGYVQSSITSQIQLLEKELGIRLFERLGKKISLTSEGKEFLSYAKQFLDLWEEAKSVASASDAIKGTLSIGVVESVCAFKLPKLLKEYNKCYPNVEIILKTSNSRKLQSSLIENEIDVAILLDSKISSPEFIIEFKQQEPVSLLATPDHPLARKNFVYPEDLSEHSLLLTRQGCFFRNVFEKVLVDTNVASKITLDTSNIQTIKQLAILGFGITLLPRFTVIDELKNNQLIELCWSGPAFDIMSQVICHKDKWISPALKAFITLIQQNGF